MRARVAATLRAALFSHRPAFAMMPDYVATNFADNLLFVLSLFDRLNIPHVVHYGTLLGVVRLGGVAPWDEDADVYVIETELPALQALLAPWLEAHGFEAYLTDAHDALIIRQVPWVAGQGHIGISALPYTLDDADDPARMEWDAFMRRSELNPLRRYPYYGSYVAGPAKPEPVLERLYGASGTCEAMRRFNAPVIAPARRAFWAQHRPIDGDADWAGISRAFSARARALPWHAATFPWWWFNGAYNIGVRKARELGAALEPRAGASVS